MHENMQEYSKEEGARVMRKGSRPMKKLLFLGVGSALLFTMGGIGSAQADGGVHYSSAAPVAGGLIQIANAGAERCAACHRAHTSQGAYNLKAAQPTLCYSCHGSAATGSNEDVQNGVGLMGSKGLALRGGGFDNAMIDSGNAKKTMGPADPITGKASTTLQTIPVLGAGAPTTSSHNINGIDGAGGAAGLNAGTAWGNGAISATANYGKTLTLECGSCHNPHGNGNFRILKPIPVDSQYVVTPAVAPNAIDPATGLVSVAGVKAVMSNLAGVKVPDETTKTYTTADYWQTGASTSPAIVNGVTVTTSPDGFIANIGSWCATCHSRYLAPSGSGNASSGDAVFNYRHTATRVDKVGAANCITCHVSHGSNAAMAGEAALVMQPNGLAAPIKRAGALPDSRLLRVDNRGTCVMCHNV
jgi:predicted CXXCH cytochrome family protein